jgi:menaquinone-9 beta-reductase
MSAHPGTPRPIEIVGGGLAGLSLGLALRRQGVPVTLHEAGDYPRHRVCGEFITGLASPTVARLGLAPLLADALLHREVAWFMGAHPARIHRLPSPALGLSRHALDARLARSFVTAGGALNTHSRIAVQANLAGRVIATGRRRGADPTWLGLKLHARGLPLTRGLEMHLGEHSYVGLARVEDGAVNVCGLFRRRPVVGRGTDVLLAYLQAAGLDALAARLGAAHVEPGSFCAVAALDFAGRTGPPEGLCLGDASAMIPPFTGNGMAMAFQSAELALAPLLSYARGDCEWTETCQAVHAALRARFRVRLASAAALHPFLLKPRRQRWFAALSRARLIPFRPLYATLH